MLVSRSEQIGRYQQKYQQNWRLPRRSSERARTLKDYFTLILLRNLNEPEHARTDANGGMVPRDRIELPTRGFSIRCSTN